IKTARLTDGSPLLPSLRALMPLMPTLNYRTVTKQRSDQWGVWFVVAAPILILGIFFAAAALMQDSLITVDGRSWCRAYAYAGLPASAILLAMVVMAFRMRAESPSASVGLSQSG